MAPRITGRDRMKVTPATSEAQPGRSGAATRPWGAMAASSARVSAKQAVAAPNTAGAPKA